MMPAIRIMVVEDEEDLARLLSYNLKREGFSPVEVGNGSDVIRMVRSGKPDLVLLDLMLPGTGGMEVCRMLKGSPDTRNIPVIMLTAKGEEIDKVLGLELGADDYITKPFSINEVIARIRAVLRRAGHAPEPDGSPISFGDIKIRKDSCTVLKAGRLLDLSATEYKILLYLAERRGKVFSRDQILDALWGDLSHVEPRTVDVHIRHLRSMVEDEPSAPRHIRTRRGIGYYIGEDEP
jgi:DNA-binding response OmpR family regulator